MTRANDLASLVDSTGDIVAAALDNVPPADLVNDTTPQLGGTLDTGSHPIDSANGVFLQHNGDTRVRTTANGIFTNLQPPVSNASVTAIQNGNAFEWGHGNTAGYRSTLGCLSGGGQQFVALHAEHGTNNNTFRTRGLKGTAILSDTLGGMDFVRISNANADNQSYSTVMSQHDRGYMEFAVGSSDGTGTWKVVKEGDTVRCHKSFSAGASAANVNLFGMRRHYWGGGHYKISLRRTYYDHSQETTYWVNGNTRPGYSLSFPRSAVNGDLGSSRIYQVSRTSSYPGDGTVSNWSIIGLNIPSYYQFEVIMEINAHNAAWRFDDAGISGAGNSWRLL